MKKIFLTAQLLAALCQRAAAQNYDTNVVTVGTLAGSSFTGQVNGTGTNTMFNSPSSIVADTSGNLFVWDSGNKCVRKVTTNGVVTTFAGGGGNNPPGVGTNITFGSYSFNNMIIDRSNNLWSTASGAVLKINPTGYVAFVSTPALPGLGGGICFDSTNNLYYSDTAGNHIYRYNTNGTVEIFVGSGNTGSLNGNGVFNSFNAPSWLVADAGDNIYVWDSGNHLIRRISQNRDVTTFAGSGTAANADGQGAAAAFSSVSALTPDGAGNFLLACGSSIRKLTTSGRVLTEAGNFSTSGYADGSGSFARFTNSTGVYASQGAVYVADTGNQRIRKILLSNATVTYGAYLDFNIYAAVKITGATGTSYRIESSPDFNVWTSEGSVTLTNSPYLWFDPNPLTTQKFYRAVLLP